MVIRFLCPNGHQLSAPENMAGKAGKCPKCSLAFAIPTLEELAATEAEEAAPEEPEAKPEELADASKETASERSESEAAPPSAEPLSASGAFDLGGLSSTGTVGVGSGTGTSSKETFVFLCPNGHKLNGPPTLKGKPGQCPHCNARFRIPSDEDLQEPEGEAEDEAEASSEFAPASAGLSGFIPPEMQDEAEADEEEELLDVGEEDIEVYVDPPLAEGHALGYIFARLWDQRQEDTQVELFLKEGEIITPDFYCDNLSCREYGVFANRDGSEMFSFTLIPWDDVRRINVRRLPILPRPMFR